MNGARLAKALAALDRQALAAADPQRETEILRRRARAIAVERVDPEPAELSVLVLQFGGLLFGIPGETVSAIAMVRSMTGLPGVPSPVVGLLGIRGSLITAIDIAQMADRSRPPSSRAMIDASKAVVVSRGRREVAVLAEELLGIRELRATEIQSVGVATDGSVVRMLGPDGLQIVDVAAVFSDPVLRTTRAGD